MFTTVSFMCDELYDSFRVSGTHIILTVRKFENGIAELKPSPGCPIDKFAEIIVGCFDEGSNFEVMLQRIFRTNDKLVGIRGFFNDRALDMASKGTTAEQVASKWCEWANRM